MSKDLISFYTDVLSAINIAPDAEGLLSFGEIDSGDSYPVVIKDLRLALPHTSIIGRDNWHKSFVAFHPLAENVVRGESDVLKKLRHWANVRLNAVISELMSQLVDIAANRDSHGSLNSKQKGLLAIAPEVDEKTLKVWTAIATTLNPLDTNTNFVNMYLMRGTVLNGTQYQRVCAVDFPIMKYMEPMVTVDTDAAGKNHNVYRIGKHSMRKKDKEAIYAVLNYVLKDVEDAGRYSAGSNATVAPYFSALLTAFSNVARDLNSITSLFHKRLDRADRLSINLNWMNDLATIGDLRNQLPMTLPLNDGAPVKGSKSSTPAPVDIPVSPMANPYAIPYTATAPLASMVRVEAPAKPTAPKRVEDNGMDLQQAVVAAQQPVYPYAPPPAPPQYPTPYGYPPQYAQQPPPGYYPPQFGQPQPQMQPYPQQPVTAPLAYLTGNGPRPMASQTPYGYGQPQLPVATSARHEAHLRSRGELPPLYPPMPPQQMGYGAPAPGYGNYPQFR